MSSNNTKNSLQWNYYDIKNASGYQKASAPLP